MRAISCWLIGAGLGAISLMVQAQAPNKPYMEYARHIKAADMVSPLKSDLFGESVSLYNGSTEFVATDVDLPGNSTVPVRIGRKFKIESMPEFAEILGGFGSWSIDVPYITGTFLAQDGWMTADGSGRRCSRFSVPARWAQYEANDFYSGVRLNIPGKGEQEILRTGASSEPILHAPFARLPLPTDGQIYPLGTRNFDRIRCKPNTANGFPGEGFIVRDTAGLTYTFDVGFRRKAGSIEKPYYGLIDTGRPLIASRDQIYLAVSRIEDRFGNFVTYEWTGDKLMRVSASDGRTISVTWSGNVITKLSAGARQWNYLYGIESMDVVQPDGSRWQIGVTGPIFMQYGFGDNGSNGPGCPEPLPPIGPPQVAWPRVVIKSPSGATGTFDFQAIRHRRSGIPSSACTIVYTDATSGTSTYEMGVPAYHDVYSLVSKSIAGVGLLTRNWSYEYETIGEGLDNSNTYPCTYHCQDVKSVTVRQPDGTSQEHRFGTVWQWNDGQLYGVFTRDGEGTVVRSEVHDYMTSQTASSQPFADIYGAQTAGDDGVPYLIRPLVRTTISQSGVVPGPVYWTAPPPPPPCTGDNCIPPPPPPPPPCDPRTGLCENPTVLTAMRTRTATQAARGSVGSFSSQQTSSTGGTTTFVSAIEAFDQFARPVRVQKTSSLGYARTDATSYFNQTLLWVVGLPERQTNVNTGAVYEETQYDPATAHALRTYRFGKLQHHLGYHGDGTLASVVDGRNQGTLLTSWHRGIPRLIQHADGMSEFAELDLNGWISAVTDETGSKTCYTYDPMGRMNRVTHPSESQAGVCDTSTWAPTTQTFEPVDAMEYGIPTGHWRLTRATGAARSITYFDALWQPLLTREFDSSAGMEASTARFVAKRYDTEGRENFASYPLATVSNVAGVSLGTRTTYDALGRVLTMAQDSELGTPVLTTTEYLPGFRTQVTNPRGRVTTASFMAWDQPNSDLPAHIVHPESANTDIWRDIFGKPVTMTRRSTAGDVALSRQFRYDGYQQLCKTVEPETGVSVSTYDAAGNLDWTATGQSLNSNDCSDLASVPASQRVTRSYDVRNRLTNLNFPDGNGSQTWSYTLHGLPARVTTWNNNGATNVVNAYNYNKRRMLDGQGDTVEQPGWYTWGIGYAYDANGNLAGQRYPTGLYVDYAPNALGQATRAGPYAQNASYYPNGAIKQFTYGNGITHTMTQNARQLPARVTDSGNALDFEYVFDANGNASQIYDYVSGMSTAQHRYMQYDGLDRLVAAGSAMFGGADHYHRYAYDALDNMLSSKLSGVKEHNYIYDAANRISMVRNDAGAATIALEYDARGNVLVRNGQTYNFDYGNRLRLVPGKEAYRYDAYGRRFQTTKVGNSIDLWQYSQSGQLMFGWKGPVNETTHEYVYLAGSLVATIDHAWPSNAIIATKYQHTDALGSPVAMTNEAGHVIERTNYEPYGAAIGKVVNGVGYTGHVMDAATGLTYMQQRYYDPSIGRFLSVDPVTAYGGDMRHFNRYSYAYNNPYKFTDPDGRCPVCFPIAVAFKLLLTSGDANAPAPGERTSSMSRGDAMASVAGALPAGKLGTATKMAVDAGKQAAQSANKKQTGSYTNTHESGKTYDGKGSRDRSQTSAQRVEKETGDKHVATDWTPASTSREGFKQESQRLDSHGGSRSDANHNKIESPGKRMRQEDLK